MREEEDILSHSSFSFASITAWKEVTATHSLLPHPFPLTPPIIKFGKEKAIIQQRDW